MLVTPCPYEPELRLLPILLDAATHDFLIMPLALSAQS